MSSPARSTPTLAPLESAPRRVFETPELVSLILTSLTQHELAGVLSVSETVYFQGQRLLFQSPAVNKLRAEDDRLDYLGYGIRDSPKPVTKLRLGFCDETSPSKRQVRGLLERCSDLVELELAGITDNIVFDLNAALKPVASQLVKLTLGFPERSVQQSTSTFRLLAAYTSLRHLILTRFRFSSDRRSLYHPPSYRLRRLQLDDPAYYIDIGDFKWLMGSSRASLKALGPISLTAAALQALAKLAPALESATLNISPTDEEELQAALKVTAQPGISEVVIEVDNADWQLPEEEWARAKDHIANEGDQLDPQASDKVTLSFINISDQPDAPVQFAAEDDGEGDDSDVDGGLSDESQSDESQSDDSE